MEKEQGVGVSARRRKSLESELQVYNYIILIFQLMSSINKPIQSIFDKNLIFTVKYSLIAG